MAFFNLKKLFEKQTAAPAADEPVLWVGSMMTNQTREELAEETTSLFNIPVRPAALPGTGRIWHVQSPQGGDGATTVATNLAVLLAKEHAGQIVLVDLDGFGAVRSRMGLPTSQCLVNITDWQEIESVAEMDRAMVEHSSGVMVIPGVLHLDHLSFITPALVFKLLSILKQHFAYIILDCPPVGQNNSAWAAALVSDLVLTVLKPSRSSLDLVQENLSYLARLGCDKRTKVILNQAGLPGGIKTADLLQDGLGFTIFAHLPYSVSVEESNNRRVPVASVKPRDEFSLALKKLMVNH